MRRGENSVDAACTARHKYHPFKHQADARAAGAVLQWQASNKTHPEWKKQDLASCDCLLVRLEQCWYVQRKSLQSVSPSFLMLQMLETDFGTGHEAWHI